MEPRWVAVLWCVCAIMAGTRAAAVPTPDTLVVAREGGKTEAPSLANEEAPISTTEPAPTTEEPAPPVKINEMTVRSEIALRYARTVVVTKVRNPAKKAQEAAFRVLLPETAFISGFIMTLDGKSYKAYVKEKEEAKQIYSDAVNAGIGAAHIATKARDSNHFTVSVNVEANTTAVFNLTYEELLIRRNKVYNHAINLHPGTLVPKLKVTVHIKEAHKLTALRVPEVRTGNEVDATEDDPQNSNAVIERGHDDREATITFSPDLEEQKRLMQVYADKSKESQSHVRSYYGTEAEKETDGVLGQFVVQYDVDRPNDGEILVNDGYFVHFFAPSDLPPLNKHVVFVLDTSGSMMDRKIVQLREAMQTILGELNPGDYFSIVEFATSVKVYDLKEADSEPPKPQYPYYTFEEKPATLVPPSRATPDNIARAKAIVSRLSANGGTNIASALNVAVELINKGIGWTPEPTTPKPTKQKTSSNDPPEGEALPKPLADTEKAAEETTIKPEATTKAVSADLAKPEDKVNNNLEPIIIFLTDGDPTVGETDPVRIINRLTEKNYGPNKAAIFSLAFGEDADRKFLRKLSLRNDGFMRHIYEAADAALQLRDFYRQVSSPLLADVHFIYPKEQIKEGSVTKNKFRTYYGGSETVVAGRLAAGGADLTPTVTGFCGVDDDHNKKKKYSVVPKPDSGRLSGEYLPLERVWAYLTIKQLLDERDAADSPAGKDQEDTPEKKALQIALKYEFVTPLTSLVVVKPNATNAIDAESVDKQDSPYGMALPASGMAGAPQFAYKAAFSSAVGQVQEPLASYPMPAMAFDSAPIAYEESAEDYDNGLRGLLSRKSSAKFLPADEETTDILRYPQHESGATTESVAPAAMSNRLFFHHHQHHTISSHGGSGFGAPIPQILSTTPVLFLPSPPAAPPSPLEPYHLQEYSWVQDALKPGADAIELDAENNGTISSVKLELTKDDVAPKEANEVECQRATNGTAGICVYLTRCDAAKSITLDQYKHTYCIVDNKYAGVCCPRDKVDVNVTKP